MLPVPLREGVGVRGTGPLPPPAGAIARLFGTTNPLLNTHGRPINARAETVPTSRDASRQLRAPTLTGKPGGQRAVPALTCLHQLKRLATRAFDHDSARLAKAIRLFEKRHALGAQLGDPRIEIGHAQRDVVLQLSA